MKKTAKLLAILLAVLLGTSLLTSLVTAKTGTLPPEKGSFTIHKYILDDLADAGEPNDGRELPYTGGPAVPDAEPVEGIVFKLYKLLIDTTTTVDPFENVDNQNPNNAPWNNTPWADLIAGYNNISFLLDPSYENPTKILLTDGLTFKGPSGDDFELDFFNLGPAITMPETDEDGMAFIDDLDKGFYLVVEQLNDKVASIVFPFIVAIPMTNADGDGWIRNVHAYPKNGDISINKDIDRNAVYLGEEVVFTVVVSVPADIKHYQTFFLTDYLDKALTYKEGSMVVTGIMNEDDAINATGAFNIPAKAAAPFNWVLTLEEEPFEGDGSRMLMVDFIDAGTPKIDGRDELFRCKFVRFDFTCYVNEAILDRSDDDPDHLSYTAYNTAEINFKNRFDTDTSEGVDDDEGRRPKRGRTRESEPVDVHTAAILFLKEDAHTGEALEDAQFQIASSEANARNGNFLKKVLMSVEGKNGYEDVWTVIDFDDDATDYWTYDVNFNGVVSDTETVRTKFTYAEVPDWIETSAIAVPADYVGYTTVSVAGKAVVRFEGLKEFNNRVADYPLLGKESTSTASAYRPSYWVVEVQAPTVNGVSYNLLLEPIELTFSRAVSGYGNWYTLNGGVVRNTNTFTLPRTGGISTILFTAGGIALIGVAALLFIVGAKKKKAKAQG